MTAHLPTSPGPHNIFQASQEDAGFERILKFKKGDYFCDGQEVALGTQFVAHAIGWTKTWVRFVDGTVTKREIYKIVEGQRPCDRYELGDNDETKWPTGLNNLPVDPWVLQYLLPLDDMAGALYVFTTHSFAGTRAVADLCSVWGPKNMKSIESGQPIIKLRKIMMPTKTFGNIPRPMFEIVGWDGGRAGIQTVRVGPDTFPGDSSEEDVPY